MVTEVVVLFATLWVDLCLAHYSLYISEENLQSYYSNSAYVDLIQGQFVPIVDDGEVLIGDGGALLLIEVTSGSGVSGSGYSLSPVHDVTGRSLDYSSMKSLPPFPAHVDTVNFTWISKTMVSNQEKRRGLPVLCSFVVRGTWESSKTGRFGRVLFL
jgi:hypothetical protein